MNNAVIVVFPGTNGDWDMEKALKSSSFNVKKIWYHEELPKSDLIVIPGGFSYGDYLRTGALAAYSNIVEDIIKAAKSGVAVMGICNGFQILMEAKLLPGLVVTNKELKFLSGWINLTIENNSSVFSSNYKKGQEVMFPIAHGMGLYMAKDRVIEELEEENRVLLRYTNMHEMDNLEDSVCINGAVNNIAGIVNKEGNVMGMMPHPERAMDDLIGGSDGRALFKSILNG